MKLIAFFAGLLFALGLALSGMTNPHKVQAFLDITGNWDPSLMFVMVGAISVYGIGYRLVRAKRGSPVLSREWHVPPRGEITPALIAGALIFGMGWGLAGYCPGPALVSVGALKSSALIFVAAMLAGMLAFRAADRRWKIRR